MADNTLTEAGSKKSQKSLYRFLAVIAFVSIVVPAGVSGAFLIAKNYQRTIAQDSLTRAKSYADLLEAGMAIPLWNVSRELGQPLIESVFVDSSVLSVVVYAERGEPFLEYVRSAESTEQESVTYTRDVTHQQNTIGHVELIYSFKGARERADDETQLLAIIIAVQLIFSLSTISFVLHRRVLLPLKKLGVSAAGIAGGDLRTTIPSLHNDEFGELSKGLESMREALEESFTQLEKRVDERTLELQTVNYALRGTLDQLYQMQGSLIQSEKLAALGSLVAGVAHELNTPIGNGLTVASSLRESNERFAKQMEDGLKRSEFDKYLDDIREGVNLVCRNLEKASELVSGFKQVAMDRASAQRRTFSLLSIIHETVLTLSPAFKRTPFTVNIDKVEDVTFDSYPGPLGQVITNLLNNSIVHAFDGRSDGQILISSRVMDDSVELIVEDNGIGISQVNQRKIFDPFFTTKLGAGGSGLGMHIVHNIVTGVLGGTITLTSELGKGTAFTLILPRAAPRDESSGSGKDD